MRHEMLCAPAMLALLLLTAPLGAAPVPEGEVLFAQNCAACHGELGRGDGPSAPALQPAPADLLGAFRHGDTPTAVFRTVSEGVHGTAMAPFQDALTESHRWSLVRYVMTLRGEWPGTPDDACGAP